MPQPQHPAQPIDPAVRADDESSVAGAQQATPAWQSQRDMATYAAPAQSALLAVQIGTLVAERYEVVQALGEGGMGLVFRAKDRKLRRDLVLKFIRPDLVHQPGMVERLCAEAEAAAALNHPHVVTLHNRESDPHGEFLIMEFVDGPNLLQLLKDAGGKLSVERAVRYIGQVGSALQAAHGAGILHRDVKPSNVLINPSDIAKLADFGLARIVEDSGQTKSGAVLGTLDYMAPEQLRDARLASPHSDQFSLAAMLYQLVVGNSPLRIRERDIPAELRDVLLRAVEDQPQKRFPSVAEFIQALPRSSVAEASRLSSDARHVGHNEPADLAKEFARLHAAAQQQSIEARQAFEQHDYERAAKIGGQIPEELRDGQLLRVSITKRDRVVELDRVITEATPAMKLAVLRPAVDELLQLQPSRQDMQRLKEQIAHLIPATTMQVPSTITSRFFKMLLGITDVGPTVEASTISSPRPSNLGIVTWRNGIFRLGRKAGERAAFKLEGIEYAFRWCPPGKFTMGSPNGEIARRDDEDQVDVELTSGFWMQETTVTQEMWRAVMGTHTQPWEDKQMESATFPATYVNWLGASEFSTKLTAAARELGVLQSTSAIVLPTEARWEYACRAGTATAYSFGTDGHKLEKYGWYKEYGSSDWQLILHEVGEKKPNPWGLLDLHGNVWEWCQDNYEKTLPGGRDPCVIVGTWRVLRGGAFCSPFMECRSSSRTGADPSVSEDFLGFRVVLDL